MRRIRGWTGFNALVVALGLVAVLAGSAQAAPMMTYNTIGSTIGSSTVADPGGVTYVPVTGASFLAPSALSLGAFQIQPVTDGQMVTYSNVPFTITLNSTMVGGAAPNPNTTPVSITGTLSGTINGPSQTSLVATFNQPAATTNPDGTVNNDPGYQFVTGLYSNTLKVADNPLHLVPSTTGSGETSIQALLTNSVVTSPVPEPSTLLLFAATAAGLGLRRQIRRARLAD
jgi:PEP-CTERM motif